MIRNPLHLAAAIVLAVLPTCAFAQGSATDYVTFWSGDLRVIADLDDTQVTLIDLDTGAPLDLTPPRDSRISTANVTSNPFVLQAGESFEGLGGAGPISNEIRVQIVTSAAVGVGDRPVIAWTGSLDSSTRHPPNPPTTANPWVSYLPAKPNADGEVGKEFLGFTTRELYIFAPRTGTPVSITIDDFVTNVDGDDDDDYSLSSMSPELVFSNAELEVFFIDTFEDDTLRITSNIDISVQTGIRSGFQSDWTTTPPSFAAGDDGSELGTIFYTFANSYLSVFPTQDNTTVTITDLSDGDDTITVTLADGDPIGGYDFYTPSLTAASGGTVVPRPSGPQVDIFNNNPNTFDNDFVKIESDKPVLVYVGPIGSNVNEFADVSFSVPTGPQSRIVYTYGQNSGGSNDLQIFAFDPSTEVTITSLTRTDGFRAPVFHDFTIGPGVGGANGWLEGVGTPGSDVWWGSDVWSGELLRIESNKPITVINGDYDTPHFGAYIPFVIQTPTLPPVAIASASPVDICPGDTVNLDGSASFDQDSIPGMLPPKHEWDFDITVDSDLDGTPDNDVDATGPMVSTTFPSGVFTVQLTYTDEEGESDTDFVMINAIDDTPPVFACPTGASTVSDPGQCSASVVYTVTVTDDCSTPVWECSPMSGSVFPVGTTTVSCEAMDDSGNMATCTFPVTVTDAEAPTISCQGNIVTNTDVGSCDAVVSFNVTATDNCGATVSCTPASGSIFAAGTTSVSCVATDAAGNTAQCSFQVEVVDVETPVITCPADITVGTDAGQCDATVSFAAMVTDNCAGASVTCTPASGSAFPVGVNAVQCTASDAAGNTSSCSFNVTVADGEDPAVSCPADITVTAAAGACDASVTFTANTTDNCPGASVSCAPASGSTFGLGTTAVNCTATDAAGNTATCSFNVTVADGEAPTITCPADITVASSGGSCDAAVTYSVAATDLCSAATVICTPASGSVFGLGTTAVSCTAVDAAGNSSSCSFNVTVTDGEAPTIACPADFTLTSDPGACGAVPTFSVTATDACTSATVSCSPATGTFVPVGTTTVACTATDTAGNTATCSFNVTVTDGEAPAITCPADVTYDCAAGNCVPTPGVRTFNVLDHPDGSVRPPNYCLRIDNLFAGIAGASGGATTFSCEAAGAGVTLEVNDNTGEITISGTVYGGEDAGSAYGFGEGLYSVAMTFTGFNTLADGWTGTLGTGAGTITSISGAAGFSLDLYDYGMDPSFLLRNDGHRLASSYGWSGRGWLTNDPARSNWAGTQDWVFTAQEVNECPAGDPVVTDNCGVADVQWSDNVIQGCGSTFTIERTYTAVDDSGNSSQCLQIINVADTTAPVIQCNTPATIPPVRARRGGGEEDDEGSAAAEEDDEGSRGGEEDDEGSAAAEEDDEGSHGCEEDDEGAGSGSGGAFCITATATDDCGSVVVTLTNFSCTSGTCEATINGDTICIESAEDGDTLCWTVTAVDECGNTSTSQCCVVVQRGGGEEDDEGSAGPSEEDDEGSAGPSEEDDEGSAGPSEEDDEGSAGPSEEDDEGSAGPSEEDDE